MRKNVDLVGYGDFLAPGDPDFASPVLGRKRNGVPLDDSDPTEELAVIRGVARMITSTQEIDQVYEKVAVEIKKLVDFDLAVISTLDRDAATSVIRFISGPALPDLHIGQTVPLLRSQTQHLMQTGQSLIRPDVAAQPRFCQDQTLLKLGMRCSILVPLIARGSVIGELALHSHQIGTYGRREQVILEALANQIAPAIDTASLSQRLQASTAEMALVDEVARIITSTLNIEDVYEKFCAEMKKLVDFDRAAINVIDYDAGTYTVKYVFGQALPGHYVGDTVPLDGTLTHYLMKTGQTFIQLDRTEGPRFPGDEVRLETDLRAGIGIPLAAKGRIIGSLRLRSYQVGPYGPREQAILERLASQIAPAIENARLYEQTRKLSHAVEQSPSSVVITDTKGKIQYVNPKFTQITGYTLEEILGKNVAILKSEETPPQEYQRVWETVTSGKEWRGECYNQKKNGELYLSSQSISSIRDAEGNIAHFIAVEEDITERRLLQQQLLQSQKMDSIGRLAGGVAHDFNNLLTAILGYAQLGLAELPPGYLVGSYLQEIQTAAERATSLTRQLLAFSRRQVIEPRPVNLNDLILDMDKMLRRLIGEDIELVTLPSPEVGLAKVDPHQIERVLMNLAANARDAMPTGGKLIIETDNVTLDAEYARQQLDVTPGDYIMVAVSDTGMGMTEAVKAHLFEPFFTTKETDKGTGLGLATCYGIIKQSGGHIAADSELGQGTTFRIYLPRVEQPGNDQPEEDQTLRPPRGTETVLLVEDEPLVRAMAARVLRGQGYTVVEVANGVEALHASREQAGERIHLLLTDVVMPQMSGTELAQQLRATRPDMKVMFTSGYTNQAIHRGILDSGLAFIQKPFMPDVLALKVRQVLDQ